MFRILSIITGYICGCFLTADIVAKRVKKKSVFELGSGNPGMANVMAECGFAAGIVTLAGDLAKTVLACVVCRFAPLPGILTAADHVTACAYAGLGACLGHDFPFWHRFRGGKGVSTTCAALFCISPLWGLLAMAAGMFVVFGTDALPLGAVFIPGVFIPISAFLFDNIEIVLVISAMTVLMLSRHIKGIIGMAKGTEKKVRVAGTLKEKLGKYTMVCIAAGTAAVFVLALWLQLKG